MASLKTTVALLSVLFLATVSAIPQNQPEPSDVRSYYEVLGDSAPGEKCRKLAINEYSAVLTDSVNRQDHLALALAYDAFADAHLQC